MGLITCFFLFFIFNRISRERTPYNSSKIEIVSYMLLTNSSKGAIMETTPLFILYSPIFLILRKLVTTHMHERTKYGYYVSTTCLKLCHEMHILPFFQKES